jgi:hypothetical protein
VIDILQGDVIYNKFLTDKVEVKIKDSIIEKISNGCVIFLEYLKEELKHTLSPCLKDDLKMMAKIIEELRRLKSIDNEEGSLFLTISEFLIFKFAIENVTGLVGSITLANVLSIQYMEFKIYLEEKYRTLNENEVKVYYEFLATYDTLKERVLN